MLYDLIPASAEQGPRAKITFEDDEIRVVAYAFSEHIRRLRDKGNPGSVSDFDIWMSNPSKKNEKDGRQLKAAKTLDEAGGPIVEVLQSFVDNTEEVVEQMWDTNEPAMYTGINAGKREQASLSAQLLIEQIGRCARIELQDTPEARASMHKGLEELLSNHDRPAE